MIVIYSLPVNSFMYTPGGKNLLPKNACLPG